MEIKFSRHARRRAKLYNISESTIEKIINDYSSLNGKHEIITNVSGFKHPIKIVFTIEDDIMTVITQYPYKERGHE